MSVRLTHHTITYLSQGTPNQTKGHKNPPTPRDSFSVAMILAPPPCLIPPLLKQSFLGHFIYPNILTQFAYVFCSKLRLFLGTSPLAFEKTKNYFLSLWTTFNTDVLDLGKFLLKSNMAQTKFYGYLLNIGSNQALSFCVGFFICSDQNSFADNFISEIKFLRHFPPCWFCDGKQMMSKHLTFPSQIFLSQMQLMIFHVLSFSSESR